MYQVIDRVTGEKQGAVSKTLRAARRKIDRLDNKYGGYRYTYRLITNH